MKRPPFAVRGISHVGLAPKDPEKARLFFAETLGLAHFGDELVAQQQTNTCMFASSTLPADSGEAASARLEILVPSPEGEGPIAKFLAKKGSGLHHIALAVDDVDAAIAHLMSRGVRMIDETARGGAHATRIAFVHPDSTGGLLVELVQETSAHPS